MVRSFILIFPAQGKSSCLRRGDVCIFTEGEGSTPSQQILPTADLLRRRKEVVAALVQNACHSGKKLELRLRRQKKEQPDSNDSVEAPPEERGVLHRFTSDLSTGELLREFRHQSWRGIDAENFEATVTQRFRDWETKTATEIEYGTA